MDIQKPKETATSVETGTKRKASECKASEHKADNGKASKCKAGNGKAKRPKSGVRVLPESVSVSQLRRGI